MTEVAAFITGSALLGLGLSADAFSVSVADGLAAPGMPRGRIVLTAGTFALFQSLMPMAGWLCAHTASVHLDGFAVFIPWIAAVLLLFIGGKMILDSVRGTAAPATSAGTLPLQGLATSVDALSAGFAAAGQPLSGALLSSAVIGAVTFTVCIAGLLLGRRVGGALSGRAQLVGGIILLLIAVNIVFTQ